MQLGGRESVVLVSLAGGLSSGEPGRSSSLGRGRWRLTSQRVAMAPRDLAIGLLSMATGPTTVGDCGRPGGDSPWGSGDCHRHRWRFTSVSMAIHPRVLGDSPEVDWRLTPGGLAIHSRVIGDSAEVFGDPIRQRNRQRSQSNRQR